MKSLARFVRMTLAGGVLFLLPIVVLVMLLGKAMQVVHKLVLPLAAKIPVESVIGLDTPRMLAIVLLIAVCFLAGVLARTAVAGKATSKVEGILSNLPGYDFIKSLSMNLLSPDSVEKRPIVLARIEDSWQIATIVERIDANHVAVYVPGTPDPKAGAVYLMGNDRIRETGVSTMAAMRCAKRYGIGAKDLFAGHLEFPAPDGEGGASDSARDRP